MTNSELIHGLFDKVRQDILSGFQFEADKAYYLKSMADSEFFIRNYCPNWSEHLGLNALGVGVDLGVINHSFDIACFEYCQPIIEQLKIEAKNEG